MLLLQGGESNDHRLRSRDSVLPDPFHHFVGVTERAPLVLPEVQAVVIANEAVGFFFGSPLIVVEIHRHVEDGVHGVEITAALAGQLLKTLAQFGEVGGRVTNSDVTVCPTNHSLLAGHPLLTVKNRRNNTDAHE